MPYILKKTNGDTLATVQDATVDNSTSLTFVGRNYSGYGQPVEQNLVKLLENFANTTAPKKPVQGQLWFNSTPSSRRLLVSYDGTSFRDIANIPYSGTAPTGATTGDLWWDSYNQQIKVYDASTNTWNSNQPYGGASSSWDFSRILDNTEVDRPAIRGLILTTPVVEISNNNYIPSSTTGLTSAFPIIKKGINLTGADAITGQSANSTSTGYLFWGTAADSLKTQKVDIAESTTTGTHYLVFSTSVSGTQKLVTRSAVSYDSTTDILQVTASAALYADIAERYEADAVYEAGTVLMLGGEKEVTIAKLHATTAVAGIVSKNPAYMMNSEAGSDETHPYIALKGRVPCKIAGPIKKGDLLVASGMKPGYATAKQDTDSSDAVIGKALENFPGPEGIIEVKV
jgi:hypothetical protein